MKKHYFFLVALLLYSTSYSQDIFDDMESYTDGSEVFQDHWTSWSGTSADAIFASSAQAHSGSLSGLVPDNGTTDGVLDLGSKIFGRWYLQFNMYVPSNHEAYWNLQGEVPIGAGQWVVGNIFFNQGLLSPGVGLIDDSALGAVTFPFPHDEWFEIQMEWDINLGISAAVWGMNVDGNEVIPLGTAYTSADGTPATSLGGIDFFSISANNLYYLDDFIFQKPIVIGIEDFNSKDFKLISSPSKNQLLFQANEAITNLSLHNLLGQQVSSAKPNTNSGSIDIAHLPQGTYLVKVTIGDTTGTIKIIK